MSRSRTFSREKVRLLSSLISKLKGSGVRIANVLKCFAAALKENMSEEVIDLTQTTTLVYKGRNGELKQLHIKQQMDPSQRNFTREDIQLLGREIAKVLREDG